MPSWRQTRSDGTPGSPIDFHDLFELLYKFSLAWKKLGLDASQLAFVWREARRWLDGPGRISSGTQVGTDFSAWRRLVQAARLQSEYFSVEQSCSPCCR